ncbi:unnamed protein product [Amoebophrya sp. A25]|nr:unnamed protein product [Amoebophrya sp. A25]|eukprot:GSA25T00012452001.1
MSMSSTVPASPNAHPGFFQAAHWILGSIFAAVACVMCNKRILSLFPTPFLLTTTHFLLTSVGQLVRTLVSSSSSRKVKDEEDDDAKEQGWTSSLGERNTMPWWEAAKIGTLGNCSIGIMNLSLGRNSVAFYQLTKVSLVPGMVLFHFLVYGRKTKLETCFVLLVITVGLVLATVTDTDLGLSGLLIGLAGVLGTVSFQLSMETAQRRYSVSGLDMQMAIAPWQLLCAFVFFLFSTDEISLLLAILGGQDERIRTLNTTELAFWWTCSCTAAQLTNYYCYTIIGVFSALTYQVCAHAKTILVLSGGLIFFGGQATWDATHLSGLVLTVVGIIWYSQIKHAEQSRSSTSGDKEKKT